MLHTLLLAVALHAAPATTFKSASPAALRTDSLRADDDIRLVALRHASEIQHCYVTRGLSVNPSLAGIVEVEIKVLPSGRVDSANVAASALAGPGREEVEACISATVKNWRFERGPFGTETIVYPFDLVRDRNAHYQATTDQS
jgi:outer membrane biosynthesis protein TonB